MQRSKRNCSVVGCHASENSTTGKDIAFYRFPGRPWEAERKARWIAAVNRMNPDGTPWQPTQNYRICSSHFVGGRKSDHPNHPSYVPTVFPAVNKKRTLNQREISCFKISEKRSKVKTTKSTKSVDILVGGDAFEEKPMLKSVVKQDLIQNIKEESVDIEDDNPSENGYPQNLLWDEVIMDNVPFQVSIKEEHVNEEDTADIYSNYREGIAYPQMMGGPMQLKEELGIYPSKNQVFAESIVPNNLEEDAEFRSDESGTDCYDEDTKRKSTAYSQKIPELQGECQSKKEDRVPEQKTLWKSMHNKLKLDDEEKNLLMDGERSGEIEGSKERGSDRLRQNHLKSKQMRNSHRESKPIVLIPNEVLVKESGSANGCGKEKVTYILSEDNNTETGFNCGRKTNVTVSEEELPSKKEKQMELGEEDTGSRMKEKKKYFSCSCGVEYSAEDFDNVLRKPIQCCACGKLLQIIDMVRQPSLVNITAKKYICNCCGKEFSGKRYLTSHERVHTGRAMYPCDFCNEDFERKGDLWRHLPSHDGKVEWICQVCGEKITHWNDVRSHQSMHKQIVWYQCADCQKEFSQKGLLRKHVQNHVLPHECKICRKHFAFSSNFNLHMIVHTGSRNWKCRICKKTFGRHEHLERHMKIHSSDKPFSCKLCDFKTVQESNLKKHQRIHTGETYKCAFCPLSYKSYKSILKHKRQMHAEELKRLNSQIK